jgi:branched-subunit amino acid transport protein AzlD
MRTFSSILMVFLVWGALAVTAHAQEVRQSPFTIPQKGEPEALIGGIDLVGAIILIIVASVYSFFTYKKMRKSHKFYEICSHLNKAENKQMLKNNNIAT